MNLRRPKTRRPRLFYLLALVLLWSACAAPGTSALSAAQSRPTQTPGPLPDTLPIQAATKRGYGLNVKGLNYDDDSLLKAVDLGWEWIKIYDYPPPERLPFKVLYRVNLPRPDEDWEQWGHYRFLDAQLYADRIDAWEIGNEPNLIEEWGKPPDPAAYARLLEIAYRQIKAGDPDGIVVSAGLAPLKSRSDPHHLNDLDYLRAMYEHGAADYFDVLGLHTFGFGRPPEVAPDGELCPALPSGRLPYLPRPSLQIDRGCQPVEGLCFRRAEQVRAIMVEYGDGGKPAWATEFGWLIRPPPCCLSRSDWTSHYWQAVSEGQQARYLLRAYDYVEANWPWMQATFLWNLDWSRYQPYDEACPNCETMGAYSILNPDGSPRTAYKWLMGEDVRH